MAAADPRQPVIVGAFEGPVGHTGRGAMELYVEAAAGAMRDAGVTPAEVDGVLTSYSWEEPLLMHSLTLAEQIGVRPRYTETVCLGGASPCGMLGRAAAAVRAGACDVAVLASASNRASGMGRTAAIAALREVAHPDYEGPFGAFVPALYALVADRHMHEFGTTPEQLARVAVDQRAHATQHPAATVKDPLTVADVLASKLVATPLHLYDCCLVTDFSAGLVVTSAERAADIDVVPVYVLGYGEDHTQATLAQAPSLTSFGAVASGRAAFAQAGVRPGDVDFAQLYDCFTITVLVTLEDLGFCGKGDGGPFVDDGALALGGRLPTNTNGGMLSYSTGGMFHLTEAVAQLRGTAGERQVEGARLGVVNGVGGILSASCTTVLGSQDGRA